MQRTLGGAVATAAKPEGGARSTSAGRGSEAGYRSSDRAGDGLHASGPAVARTADADLAHAAGNGGDRAVGRQALQRPFDDVPDDVIEDTKQPGLSRVDHT